MHVERALSSVLLSCWTEERVCDVELCVFKNADERFFIERECFFSGSDWSWSWMLDAGITGDRDLVKIGVICTTGTVCNACLEFESSGQMLCVRGRRVRGHVTPLQMMG